MIRRPQRSDSLQGVGLGFSHQDNALLAKLPEELHDMRRVQAYGQEEDLKEALGKMIGRVEEMSAILSQAQKAQIEFETNLKLAKSNLQLALANNEMLEDALRRESAIGSKDVGWRRRSDRPDSRQSHTNDPSENQANSQSRPPSRQGSVSVSVQSTPTSETMASPSPILESPVVKPTTPPVQPTQPVQHDSRFFRFRFGSSSTASSPNPSAGPSRPRTPPVSAGAASGSHRVVDALRDRERDASHLTSASLPSLVANTNKQEEELVAELAEVRAKLEKVSLEKKTLEQEVEGLSQALFEEANKMVAQERIKCAEIEEELRQVRQEKEALKSAMRVIEQENERLKMPMTTSEFILASSTSNALPASHIAGEEDTTPRSSRPISQSRRTNQSESQSQSRRSSTSDSIAVERITRPRSTSSTRGFRTKSSSSERGWASSSKSPSHASVPLPDSESESNSITSEKVEGADMDMDEEQCIAGAGTEKASETGETKGTPTVLLTSPTLPNFPFEESPWTRL